MSELSQEQIDALLKGAKGGATETGADLSQFERDTIGELGNISMGSGATTLSMLLNKSVTITAPEVSQTNLDRLYQEHGMPSILVQVKYTVGLEHANVFILQPGDCAIICDLMMGGDGTAPSPEIGEMQLSAVGEAMNQMMGTAATAMSSFFGRRVDISPPQIAFVALSSDAQIRELFAGESLTQIAFNLMVEGLVDSRMLQVLPTNSVKRLVEDLVMAHDNPDAVAAAVAAESRGQAAPAQQEETAPAAAVAPSALSSSAVASSSVAASPLAASMAEATVPASPLTAPPQHAMQPAGQPYQEAAHGGAPPPGYPPPGYPPPGYPPPGYPPPGYPPPGYQQGYPPPGYGYPPQQPSPFQQDPVGVRSASFAPLNMPAGLEGISGLDLIMDVPLRVTVELGRTRMQIRDVLDLGKGSVVELDKLAGEPVDMLVNGKLIAKGEVVVIDENFGIRVTDIVSPVERFNNIKLH
ncbi:MAG: fliN: flagellar motor switch protein FliN [Cyanobacteria bacterium RYN_339]|nr:fliN: flagellar motor switch protein FliN [Cyanobacteria bacterium RYN_339]